LGGVGAVVVVVVAVAENQWEIMDEIPGGIVV